MRQEGGTEQPEPRYPENSVKYRGVLTCLPDDGTCFIKNMPVDDRICRRRADRGNEQTGQPAGQRYPDRYAGYDCFSLLGQNEQPPYDRPQQNGDECSCAGQCIAADQLIFMQLVRQDAVFQWPKESGLGAHQKQNRH